MSPHAAPNPSSLLLDGAAQDLLFRSARTPKAFLDEPVTDEQLATVFDLVKWGPTMTNSQPLRVLLARTPEARSRVTQHLLSYNQERVAGAPVLAVFCADLAFDRFGESIFPGPAIAQMYRDDAFREKVATSQAWLQAGYWVQGLRAVGLDVLPMLGYDVAGLDAALVELQASSFAGSELRSVMVMAIGHADPGSYPPQLPRLAIDEVVADI